MSFSYTGNQCLSVNGGEVQCPPEGSGLRLTATISCSVTQRSSSSMTVAVDSGGLWQHGRGRNDPGKFRDPADEVITVARPGGRGFEITGVVGHKGCPRGEDLHVNPALIHQAQLIGFDGFADLVIRDHRAFRRRWLSRRRAQQVGPRAIGRGLKPCVYCP